MNPEPLRRICHVIGALSTGGAENVVANFMRGLRERGYEVQVVCIREIGAVGEQLRKEGFPVTLIGFRSRFNPMDLFRLARHLHRAGIQVVHTHMRRSNTSGRVAALLARVPVILAHHHNYGLSDRPRHHRIDRWLTGWTAGALAVEEGVQRFRLEATGLPKDRIRLLRNGIPLTLFDREPGSNGLREELALPGEEPLVGLVGRLHPVKRQDLLVQAAGILRDRGFRARFVLVGEGKQRASLESQIAALELEDRVHLLGSRSDVPRILSSLDLVVLCSDSEGRPLIGLECVAARVPLVCTPVGGCPELLGAEHQELVVPHDDPKALATAIRSALEPERARRVRERFSSIRDTVGLDRSLNRLEEIYQEDHRRAVEQRR